MRNAVSVLVVGALLAACGQPSGFLVGFRNLDSADYLVGFAGNSLISGTTSVGPPEDLTFVIPASTDLILGPRVQLVARGSEWVPGAMRIWTTDCEVIRSFEMAGGEYVAVIAPGGAVSLERHDFRNTYPEGATELVPAERDCS